MNPIFQIAQAAAPMAAHLLLTSVLAGLLLVLVPWAAFHMRKDVSAAFRSAVWLAAVVLVLGLSAASLWHTPSAGNAGSAWQVHVPEVWGLALLTVWAALSLWRGARLCAGLWQLAGLVRRAVPLQADPQIASLLQQSRRATVALSPEVGRPCVAGLFRPRILLPAGLGEALSSPELECVVRHEMEHLRRWDDWANLLQQISLTLLPLNPALFWLDHTLCRERELACDDGVMASTGARRTYAACLVKLAERSMQKGLRLALSALGARTRQSELVGRVYRILAAPAEVKGRGRQISFALVSVLLLSGAGLFFGADAGDWVQFEPALVQPFYTTAAVQETTDRETPIVAVPVREAATATLPMRLVDAKAVLPNAEVTAAKRRSLKTYAPRWKTAQATLLKTSFSRPATARHSHGFPSTVASGDAVFRRKVAVQQVIWTEFEVSQPRYAAVAVPDGWLILQL